MSSTQVAGKKPGSKPKAKAKPGNVKITETLWDEILMWYAANGPQHAKAAQHFGLARRTMSKLYFEGHEGLSKPKMKDLMNNVEVRARAYRSQMKQEELAEAERKVQAIINDTAMDRASSLQDAAEARAAEGLMIGVARKNIIGLQGLFAHLLRGAQSRARELEQELAKEMSPRQVLSFLRELGKFMNDINTAAKTNMEMERLLLGEPTEIIGTNIQNLSPDEAKRVLALAAKTHERLQRHNLTVIEVQAPAESGTNGTPVVDLPEPAVDDPTAGDMEFEDGEAEADEPEPEDDWADDSDD